MTPIELPPGVVQAPTRASNKAFWQETHLIRWEEGRLRPIKGWEQVSYPPTASRIRAVHVWTDNAGISYTAYLCEAHLYVDVGGVLFDISPTEPIVPPYQDTTAGGYGDDEYTLGDYGTPRPQRERTKVVGPAFTLDNWGEDLLAMTSVDGRLLRWSPSTGTATKAVRVPNSPLGRTFVVTPERHVIIFSMDGFRRFGWCDQENIENWDFANVASKAGFYDVEPAAPIVSASPTRGGVVFHTTKKSYIIRPIGLPYIYNYEEIGTGAIPFTAASVIYAGDRCVWASDGGFWAFNGSSIEPVPCPLWNWIKDNIDVVSSRYEASMVDLSSRNEIWWFFVSTGSEYNNRYVIWNYVEGWWSMGELSRSCGVGSSYTSYPIMSDGFKVYKHESGDMYPGVTKAPFAETHTMNMVSGAGLMTLRQMIPDIDGAYKDVKFSFAIAMNRIRNPDGTLDERRTTPKFMRPDGWLDVFETGRDFRMRVESAAVSAKDWTMGQTMVDAVARGKR